MKQALYVLTLGSVVLLASPPWIRAQDLEPRLYQNAPVGLNAVFFGYDFSVGNVLFDSSSPIQDGEADVHTVFAGYVRTLDFFGRSGKVDVLVPFSDADFQGFLDGVFRTRTPTGFADPRVRLAVNFTGSPPLTRQEFAEYHQETIVGASLQVIVPLGQYDSTKPINLGINRWSFRPEVGVSKSLRTWFLELAGGAWLFTRNDNFSGAERSSRILFIT